MEPNIIPYYQGMAITYTLCKLIIFVIITFEYIASITI